MYTTHAAITSEEFTGNSFLKSWTFPNQVCPIHWINLMLLFEYIFFIVVSTTNFWDCTVTILLFLRVKGLLGTVKPKILHLDEDVLIPRWTLAFLKKTPGPILALIFVLKGSYLVFSLTSHKTTGCRGIFQNLYMNRLRSKNLPVLIWNEFPKRLIGWIVLMEYLNNIAFKVCRSDLHDNGF